MNLSPSKLNQHLFAYNLSDNPFCPNCFDYIEDVNHYFFKCNAYSVYRNQMITSLYNCLNFYNVQLVNYSEKEIIGIILNGIKMNDLQGRIKREAQGALAPGPPPPRAPRN